MNSVKKRPLPLSCILILLMLLPLITGIDGCKDPFDPFNYYVEISSPANGSIFEEGDSIEFSAYLWGTLDDEPSGLFEGTIIKWTSDMDGTIWQDKVKESTLHGIEHSFSSSALTVGTHTITCSIYHHERVNELLAEDSITITIKERQGDTTTTTTIDGTSNRLIWSYDLGGGRHVSHSPVVADGKVYFTTYIDGGVDLNSGVFCLDAATGNLIWKFDPDEFPVGTYQPLVTGGKVFVTTFHGYNHANVACLDAANGSLLWEKDVTDTGSPFSFANDLVYAGSYRNLFALQPASGEFAWNTNNAIFASALTTPAVVGDYLYTTDGAGNVYCVQYKKGEPEDNWKKWTFSAGASYTAAPSVANGKVYVSNSDLKIFCLDALSGQKLWELAGAGCSSSRALAVVGDKIYTSQNNKAVCTSTGGSNVWETPLGTESSDVAVSDLYVYVATRDYSDHKLLCINAGTGAVVWEYAADNFSMYGDPVVSGGFVYIGCDKNKICCLQAQEGDGGSWPMYKYNVSRTSAK